MSASIETRYRVGGMHCATCAAKIETAVRRVPGVQDVSVSASAGTMRIRHEATTRPGQAVQSAVRQLGYSVQPAVISVPSASAVVTSCAHDDCCASHGPEHATENHRHGHGDKAPERGLHGHDHAITDASWYATPKGRLAVVCGAALAAAWIIAKLVPATAPWGFILAMAIGLVPIAQRMSALSVPARLPASWLAPWISGSIGVPRRM